MRRYAGRFAEKGGCKLTGDGERNETETAAGQLVGYFYTWWGGDPLPELEPLEAFSMEATEDTKLLSKLSGMDEQEVVRRIKDGHCSYVAFVNDDPVAYGWSAWKKAEIGELNISFDLPEGNRYLWDFLTLPDWRGHGIYPLMIQEIIRQEMDRAERFWIGHDFDNVASAKGIEKAGLPVIGEVWIQDGKPVFIPREPIVRAQAATDLLNLAMGSAE